MTEALRTAGAWAYVFYRLLFALLVALPVILIDEALRNRRMRKGRRRGK